MYREALLEEVRRAALARIRNGWRNIFVFVTRPVGHAIEEIVRFPFDCNFQFRQLKAEVVIQSLLIRIGYPLEL
jgi:hypothetical protein